jgi:sugar lactone lactonase YvrE
VAGTGSDTTNSSGFKTPSWLYIDANNTLYICDQQNNRIQMWTNGSSNGVTVAGNNTGTSGTNTTLLKQPFAVTFDDNGFMYVSDQGNNRVQRFPPNSLNSTTVAGQADGSSPNGLNSLKSPSGIAVDNNSNLYIADTGNHQIVVWAPNATNGSILIANGNLDQVYGLLLVPGSSNQVYMSTQGGTHSIYLWTFNASTPNVTLTAVSGTPNNLANPSGIALDPYGNLYVADRDPGRVVMYCVNATTGTTVVGGTGSTPALNKPIAVGFDSNLNMYVLTGTGDTVVRYALV